jgi:hypothetical protein
LTDIVKIDTLKNRIMLLGGSAAALHPVTEANPMNTITSRRRSVGRTYLPLLCATSLAVVAGCSRTQAVRTDAEPVGSGTLYVARLVPLNATVTGAEAAGEVSFSIDGDQLRITTDATGLPPGMSHWQHFHGFKDGRDAACPTSAADANGDGIVDLIETEPVSGTTMVPFNDDPVAMDVPNDTYPRSTETGALQYEKVVSLGALQSAFGKAFAGRELDLDTRVVFLHGVPAATTLAGSVASLGPIPAQVTIPIACGEIKRVR